MNWQPSTPTMDTVSRFLLKKERGKYRFKLSRKRRMDEMNNLHEDDTPVVNPYTGRSEDLPLVMLWASAETGQPGLIIPVLMQRSYTGTGVITSTLANTPCINLGVNGVLKELNTILGTLYAMDSALNSVLNSYITHGLDFGTAYAYLRPYWDDMKLSLRTNEEKDTEMRRKVLVRDRITTREVPPRRVWDLYANRVVPYWVARKQPWGISHAWVDEKDRVNVMTPINGYEWPVPIPKDTNLDLIRIEMLNFGAEYAWLDVLCLRQESGKGEYLRLDEWKLDVPTIGSVYEEAQQVVCYFNGLGRPLNLTTDYFESDRCWFRRAWTLQEITKDAIIGGETGNDALGKDVRKRFDEQLAELCMMTGLGTSLELVSEMQHRVSTNPLDKVAGLIYLLKPDSIPIYDAEQSAADAWEALVDVMQPSFRAQLLFLYPVSGDGRKCWRPSWEQLMTNTSIGDRFNEYPSRVHQTEGADADYYKGCLIKSGYVRGLSAVQTELKYRQGELVVRDATGVRHIFNFTVDHRYQIPDGFYTLIDSNDDWEHPSWVVGRLREDGKFEKLLAFRSFINRQLWRWQPRFEAQAQAQVIYLC
ncbi:hypothetical protein EV421DRAFT_2078518 [Armillaria borealis]|uniref:Heterokaryon incompatibility domain-containing protein n=1 Tax=Armillaria borealis TaxID=47425 RepID=A0AA39JVX0_9AGAR|nr:hypothetical protein EV421DRAFT_2078518 [Armillaria borealis]